MANNSLNGDGHEGKIGCAIVILSAFLVFYAIFCLSCYLIPKAITMGFSF